MPARMIVELPDGKKLLVGGAGEPLGLAEVSLIDDVREASAEQLKKALGTLAGLVEAVEDALGRLPRRPHTIELEFGARLTGECDLWIVSGESEAEFRVKLGWEHKDAPPAEAN